MQQGFRFVRRSTVMKWMSFAAILFSVLFFSLYLPFSRAATVHYPSADALAGFFGLFSAVTTAAALITSLFLTNRMITRFGVTTMLLVLALIYLAGFGVLIVSGTFVTLVVVRFVQMLWSQAVANPAWEAVINIVPPARRDQTRAFLNGGPTQLGTMIAGLIQLDRAAPLEPDPALRDRIRNGRTVDLRDVEGRTRVLGRADGCAPRGTAAGLPDRGR